MSTPPKLTDRIALERNRARVSQDALFLHSLAMDELDDRLSMVNNSFTDVAVVSGQPEYWQNFRPNARTLPDTDTLDLTTNAHDLIVHAMALHWANDPVGQLIQIRRALRPNGLFLGAMFGGRTLHELRIALAQAESDLSGGLSPRILPMAEIRDIGGLLQRAGFALPVLDIVTQKVTYPSPLHLMKELRSMGEGNALNARHKAFASKALFARAAEIYSETFGQPDGRIPATFDLIFLSGWAPDESQPKPLKPGSATTRLADALGVSETRIEVDDNPQ